MKRQLSVCGLFFIATIIVFAVPSRHSYASGLKLGDMCRLKGQEKNTLQGVGIVVGLRGTGDESPPTARSLAETLNKLGAPMGLDRAGELDLRDVEDARNVALVVVTAQIPAVGSQAGDQIDVTVHAIGAKSLEGGTLMLTPLLGPRADNRKVYAMANGALSLSLDGPATRATVQGGAKMEATVESAFHLNGKITLVLDRDFASFDTAQRIEDEINNLSQVTFRDPNNLGSGSSRTRARAIDQVHIEVMIPELYRDNPIKFISFLLSLQIRLSNQSSRVVINEREGVVVIGKDVEIAPVLVNHRNLRIDAGGGGLVTIADGSDQVGNAKLKSLADALNALDVPTEDLIAIIKTLKRKGDLFGEVIFQ